MSNYFFNQLLTYKHLHTNEEKISSELKYYQNRLVDYAVVSAL